MLTVKALHVIATAVLFDANVTLGTVLRMGTNIIGRFTIVGTFGKPFPDYMTICWRVIVRPTAKTECRRTNLTGSFLWTDVRTANDYLTIWTRTKS